VDSRASTSVRDGVVEAESVEAAFNLDTFELVDVMQ
jgi:hypothetical protein